LFILIDENEKLTEIVDFKAEEKQEVLHVKQQSDVLLSQNNNLMAVIKDQSDKIEHLRSRINDLERSAVEEVNRYSEEKLRLLGLNEEFSMKLNRVLDENVKVTAQDS
jgi:hypothetical protein